MAVSPYGRQQRPALLASFLFCFLFLFLFRLSPQSQGGLHQKEAKRKERKEKENGRPELTAGVLKHGRRHAKRKRQHRQQQKTH
jgi:hypothetical protein